MKCKFCGNEVNPEKLGKYASGEFCDYICARKFSSLQKGEINDEELKQTNCCECGKKIWIKKRASSLRSKCDECKPKKDPEKKILSYPIEEILEGKYPNYQTYKLRQRLLKFGYKDYKCEICGIEEWNEKKVPLILDHKNGYNSDHRWENLQLICPNCNAQTPYNTGKNKRKSQEKEITDEKFIDVLKNNENIRQTLIELKLDPNGSGNYKRARQLINYM